MKEKIKIMRTPPTVSDEEIGALMDFDALLHKKHKLTERRKYLRKVKITGGIATLVAVPALLAFLFLDDLRPAVDSPPKSSGMSSVDDTVRTHIDQDSSMKKDPISSSSRPSKPARPAAPPASDDARLNADDGKSAPPVRPVYHQAEPAEGYPALYDYFSRNLVYPKAAVRDSIEGIVEVVFVIDTTGEPANISIENSLGPPFDKEARRLVEEMPLWKPATYNGKPVKSKISLPITFGLEKISTP